MIIASVDLGRARTGIAVCDKLEILASPFTVISEKSPQKMLQKTAEEILKTGAELVVVGLPKNMDSSEGESAKYAREFAMKISEITKIETVMQDERCTTVTAHNYLNQTDTRGKKRKAVVDAVSAVIILQDFLDARKNKG